MTVMLGRGLALERIFNRARKHFVPKFGTGKFFSFNIEVLVAHDTAVHVSPNACQCKH